MLPHLAPDRLEDNSLVASSGPDITFGTRDPIETTANTSTPLEESKDYDKKLTSSAQLEAFDDLRKDL